MLTKLGKYEIKGELGKGAMGVVYLAQDSNLGRPAALKVMSSNLAGDPDLLKRFYREAVSAGKLGHPNIVTIYDIDQEGGVPYIAMEFLDGETLRQLIQGKRELSTVRKLDIITQACKALHFAHQNGVIHRDVKPSNIVVLKNGQVKILDFGIAHVEDASLTQPGCIIGTPFYMSPEQVRGEPVDGRSDIFSLGVILYEMFALTNPFAGRDLPSVLNRICHLTPEPLTRLLPQCPPELDRIIQKATAKAREERYANAEDLFFDLLHLGGSLKRVAVEEQYQQGQRLFEEGNLALAEESLRKALAIDSSHNLVRMLLKEVQEEIKTRQRAERVLHLLTSAAEAAQNRRDEECLKFAAEAIALDPENTRAEKYRREASDRIERERSIAEHLTKAEAKLRNGDLQAAQAELSEVLKLDPERAEALRLVDAVKRESAKRQRTLEAQANLRDAEARLGTGDFAGALKSLERADKLGAEHSQVEALRTRIRDESSRHEEEERLAAARLKAIEQARLLIQRGSYSAAIQQIEQTVALTGEFAELRDLLALANEEERKRKEIQAVLGQARKLLQDGNYKQAAELLRRKNKQFPSAEIEALLASALEGEVRLEEQRRETLKTARELLREGEVFRALSELEAASKNFADDEEFHTLYAQAHAALPQSTMLVRSEAELSGAGLDFDLAKPEPASPALHEPVAASSGSGQYVEAAVPSGISTDVEMPLQVAASDRPQRRGRILLLALVAVLAFVVLIWALAARRPNTVRQPPSVTVVTPPPPPPSVAPNAPPVPPVESSAPEAANKNGRVLRPSRPHRSPGNAAPAPEVGELTITSDVLGALITLDGGSDPTWVTPHTFPSLRAGTHHVALLRASDQKTAYKPDVEVVAGQSTTFNLPFPPPQGFVHMTTVPSGLEVFVDGRSVGKSPVDQHVGLGSHVARVQLPSGPLEWHFRVSSDGGYGEHEFSAAQGPGVTQTMGTIEIRTTPTRATVFVDGTRVGTSNVRLSLSPGRHQIMLSFPGYPSYTQTMVIVAGQAYPPIDRRLGQ